MLIWTIQQFNLAHVGSKVLRTDVDGGAHSLRFPVLQGYPVYASYLKSVPDGSYVVAVFTIFTTDFFHTLATEV